MHPQYHSPFLLASSLTTETAIWHFPLTVISWEQGTLDEILPYLASYRYHFTCGSRTFNQFLLRLLSFVSSGMKIFQLMKMCCYDNVLQHWHMHLKNINTKFQASYKNLQSTCLCFRVKWKTVLPQVVYKVN